MDPTNENSRWGCCPVLYLGEELLQLMSGKAPTRWSTFVVDIGDAARAEGFVTVMSTEGDYAYLRSYPGDLARGEDVPLLLPRALVGVAVQGDRPVEVVGTWSGEALLVESISTSVDARRPAENGPDPRKIAGPLRSLARDTAVRRPAHERALFEAGVVLALWAIGDPGGRPQMGLVTDVDVAREQLRPQHGEELVLLSSRWSAQELDTAARRLMDVAGDVLVSLGAAHGQDDQLRVAATVLCLPRRVELQLREIEERLDLKVLVLPA